MSVVLYLVFEAVELFLAQVDADRHILEGLHLEELLLMLSLVKLVALNFRLSTVLFHLVINL